MTQPIVSVIVPVYNMEKHLRRCVDSILAQTFTAFEVLLIDDGSTDGSGTICDEYAARDPRIRVFHKPNGGASSARNTGLEHARGEWVTFCDSDDYVFPCWLENYDFENSCGAQLIQQGTKSDKPNFVYQEKAACCCGFDYFGSPIGYLEKLTECRMIGYTWMKAFRLDIIRQNNLLFAVGVRLREDEIFVFSYLALVSSVKSVDRQGYFYYVPDWGCKYDFQDDKHHQMFFKAYCDAIMACLYVHGFVPAMSIFTDSLIDELMKVLAQSMKTEYFIRIRNLINLSYDACGLFTPLKRLVHYDKTGILSYPALLTHSILRKLFNK